MMSLQQIAARHYDQVNSDDYSGAADVFSSDVVTTPPGMAPMTGIAAFVAYSQGFRVAFPDGRIHGDRYVEGNGVVVVEGRFTGTNDGPLETPAGRLPATGRALDLPFADVFGIVDGKITDHRIYYDVATMMAQLGLLPEPASS
jgi:steroid delta-isomerase-like uncharacterized protein